MFKAIPGCVRPYRKPANRKDNCLYSNREEGKSLVSKGQKGENKAALMVFSTQGDIGEQGAAICDSWEFYMEQMGMGGNLLRDAKCTVPHPTARRQDLGILIFLVSAFLMQLERK